MKVLSFSISDEDNPVDNTKRHEEVNARLNDFPEDIIYENVEFREILADCISFFKEGQDIMNQLYDSVASETTQSAAL